MEEKTNETEIEIVTAKAIYELDKISHSLSSIKDSFQDFKDMMNNENEELVNRIQAWQYVKAYTKILKEQRQWDFKKCGPTNSNSWMML
jgi:hypothetical protein